jgi:formylglycine-generating enzyme required for sulfatase activity
VKQSIACILGLGTLLVLGGCSQQTNDPSTETDVRSAAPKSVTESGFPSTPSEVVTASGVAMVFLPGGTFKMGSDRGNPDEAPAHPVTLAAFLMDQTEVTHEMFVTAQLPNPSHWQDNPKNPVERIRWRDAKLYCNERSRLEGLNLCYDEKTKELECDYQANGYRLPTEAEWEYACRAGSDQDYSFGGADQLRQYGWYDENARERTHPVGGRKPNRWGIHGLYGNVSEWCEDVYSATYYAGSPGTDPTGPLDPGVDVKRVMRGGSWKSSADMCRASFRQGQRTGNTDACFYTDFCGFRCVRRATVDEFTALMKKP